MPDKCLDCPVPSADMDGFIVSGPGGAPRSEGSGVSSPEGPFVREAPQTGHFILKGKVSSSSPLPDVPEPGWAYEAAEAGTYGGVHATPGDLIWCAGVNPVQWRVAQSDFDGAVRSVSVQQVLSSGTKIATVTVNGQATDLYCEPSGLASVSAAFDCGGQTWYLSSCDVNSYPEEDVEFVDRAVAPAPIGGDLFVDLSPTHVGGSVSSYVFKRIFLLSNVPVYGGVCYWRDGGYDTYRIFVSEGYDDIAPEDLVLFSLWARIANYSMPAAGEEIELPIDLADRNNTGMLSVSEIGASASEYDCAGRDRIVVHGMPVSLSASPLKLYATGPESGYIGSLRVEKNSAFDWSRYESGAKLTLTSTSASGASSIQTVDMSCLAPPVFNGSNNGLVPAGSSGSSLKVLCSDGQWRTLASNTVNAMTGYAKAESYTAIAASDSLNTAIGKLEAGLGGSSPEVTVGTGLVNDNGTIRLALLHRTSYDHGQIITTLDSQHDTPYSYDDEEDVYEDNPTPYVIDLSQSECKFNSVSIGVYKYMMTQSQVDALKPYLKSILAKVYLKSGTNTFITYVIPSSAPTWVSNGFGFDFIIPSRSTNYPSEEIFDTIDRIELVMTNSTNTYHPYGSNIGTFFPAGSSIKVNGTYFA